MDRWRRQRRLTCKYLAVALSGLADPARSALRAADSGPLEVLHWWTSSSERLALDALESVANHDHKVWRNAAVPGGARPSAATVLRTRLLSGDPPDLAHVPAGHLRQLGEGDFLAELAQDGAAAPAWLGGLLPQALDAVRVGGRVMGIPLGVHRLNILVCHKGHWDRLGLPQPTSWDALQEAARALDHEGIAPLVWSDQGWQLLHLFENLLLSELGAQGFEALSGPGGWEQPGVAAALERLRRLRGLVPVAQRRMTGWAQAGREFLLGRAGLWFMPDWSRGELAAWGLREGRDYVVTEVPGTEDLFLFQVDSLAAFDTPPERKAEVQALAQVLLSPAVQVAYNSAKGSVPVLRALTAYSSDPAHRQHWMALSEPGLRMVAGLAHRIGFHGLRSDLMAQLLRDYVGQPALSARTVWRQMAQLNRWGLA